MDFLWRDIRGVGRYDTDSTVSRLARLCIETIYSAQRERKKPIFGVGVTEPAVSYAARFSRYLDNACIQGNKNIHSQ